MEIHVINTFKGVLVLKSSSLIAQFHSNCLSCFASMINISCPLERLLITIHCNKFKMQRLRFTERHDAAFHHTGKCYQMIDFKYWSFYIVYRPVWTVERIMLLPCRTGYSVIETPAVCNQTPM